MSELNLSTDEARVSYGVGRQLGDQLRANPVPGMSLDAVLAGLRARRPDVDPTQVVASGLDGLRTALERHVEAGGSKFVVVPLAEPADWDEHLGRVAATLLPLQT